MRLAHENELDGEDFSIPSYQPEQDDIFLPLVHVALKIRGDILAKPGHKGLSVSEQDEVSVPYMNLDMARVSPAGVACQHPPVGMKNGRGVPWCP